MQSSLHSYANPPHTLTTSEPLVHVLLPTQENEFSTRENWLAKGENQECDLAIKSVTFYLRLEGATAKRSITGYGRRRARKVRLGKESAWRVLPRSFPAQAAWPFILSHERKNEARTLVQTESRIKLAWIMPRCRQECHRRWQIHRRAPLKLPTLVPCVCSFVFVPQLGSVFLTPSQYRWN